MCWVPIVFEKELLREIDREIIRMAVSSCFQKESTGREDRTIATTFLGNLIKGVLLKLFFVLKAVFFLGKASYAR